MRKTFLTLIRMEKKKPEDFVNIANKKIDKKPSNQV